MLDEIRELIGDSKFKDLINAYDDTVRRGRFRYWQDDLFESIAGSTGGKLSFEQYVKLFANVEPPRQSVTFEQFIQDPVPYWRDETFELPEDWISKAWQESDSFIEAVCDECLCSIATTDSLAELSRNVDILARQLQSQDVVRIYQHIARWVCMPESEWRANFIAGFSSFENELPDASREDGVELATRIRDELPGLAPDNLAEQVRRWFVQPRIVSTGIGDCWLLLDTRRSWGLVYSPYGSLEPQYKWGIVSELSHTEAEDQVWVTCPIEGISELASQAN